MSEREISRKATSEQARKGREGTIRVIAGRINRPGYASASLPDGTILVVSSRQPILDAARILIGAGYDPDAWIESWRPGAAAFALRGRLRIAAGLTVDETKTVFAKWKPFSSSAVASSIDHSEMPATTTLAAASSAILQPPLEQQSKQTSATEPPAARSAPSFADECKDQIASNSDNGSSSSSRA